MKKQEKYLRFLLIVLFCSLPSFAQEWSGVYIFSEKNAPGKPIMSFTHKLTVENSTDGLTAKLKSSGHYLERNFNCTVKINGNRLNVYFNDGNQGDFHKIENLKQGDLLLSIELQKIKGKSVTTTFWGKFKPIIGNPPTGKIYFKKT